MRDQERKAAAVLMQYLGGFELALEEQGSSEAFVKEGIEDMERCLVNLRDRIDKLRARLEGEGETPRIR